MLSSGMPMIEAMEITAKTMDNQLFKDALNDCALQIQRGVPLTAPLKKSGLFPPLILHMVGIGEESGNLEEMLNNCATYFDEEVESATQQVMALMEPMIIIVLAGVVGVILAACMSPMLTMYQALDNL
jgi:type IV pilus assembly protein PilC